MPQTRNLPEPWYASPNAHLCTIKDFADLSPLVDAKVESAVAFNTSGQRLPHLAARSRCRTCLARRPCSCCASAPPAEAAALALLRGFAIPPMFPALS